MTINNSLPPNFTHPEIAWLYTYGMTIDKHKLTTLLALPKESLIADLEKVLHDSVDRFAYFAEMEAKEGYDEAKMNFVVHAIFLLSELEAYESLDRVFNILSQPEAYFHLFMGEFLTELIWEPIYKLANNNVEACKQFMFKPGIHNYAKTTIADMVEQLALHQPQRRDEALNWFREVIQFYIVSNPADNVIDREVIGLLICNIIEINGVELASDIEQLFEANIVATGICGQWPLVKEDLKNADICIGMKDILSMHDRYNDVCSTWASYNAQSDASEFSINKYFGEPQKPIVKELKIGRNDPCSCGSGKKHKKCCMKD